MDIDPRLQRFLQRCDEIGTELKLRRSSLSTRLFADGKRLEKLSSGESDIGIGRLARAEADLAALATDLSGGSWFTPVIMRWTEARLLARDLGLPAKNVRRWIDLDTIPADRFKGVAEAARVRGFDEITVDLLATIAEDRRLAGEGRTIGQVA